MFVSSLGHVVADWNPDNLNGELSYGPLKFYNNSKLYNASLIQYFLQSVHHIGFSTDFDFICPAETTSKYGHHSILSSPRSGKPVIDVHSYITCSLLSPAHSYKVDTDLNQHSKFFHLFALAVKHTGMCV